MTLKRAKLIAALIADLDKDCEHTDYVAEIKQNPFPELGCQVVLSSKDGHRNQLVDLTCFAKALDLLGTKVYMSLYSNYIELN